MRAFRDPPKKENPKTPKTGTPTNKTTQNRSKKPGEKMIVLCTMLMWSLPFVAVPYALLVGRVLDVLLVAAFYVALGVAVSRIVLPKPYSDSDSDSVLDAAPRLTLCHPHGIVCTGFAVIAFGDKKWNAKRRQYFGPPHFLCDQRLTLLAGIWTWFASCCCSSSSRASMVRLMRAKKDLYLFPGGFVEAARHSYNRDVVDVGSRGAIRLALIHGYAVRVCFVFGERKTAYNLQGMRGIRISLAKRGIPTCIPLLVPWARTPTVAFSPTIQFPLVSDPSLSDVERWHATYVATLRALHARHRGVDDELVVHGI